jgi:hypothetical protein
VSNYAPTVGSKRKPLVPSIDYARENILTLPDSYADIAVANYGRLDKFDLS